MFGQQPKNLSVRRVALVSLITTMLLAAMSFAQEFRWLEARLPLNETITGISFPTAKVGYIVTSGGKYGLSRDGGRSWDAFQIQGAPILEDVFFRAKDTGLAVGRNGKIYRTINGGVQWEDRSLKKDTTAWLTSALFLNDSVALVAGFQPTEGQPGVLYRSTDGGKQWDSVAVSGMGFGELFYTKGLPVCFQSFGKLNYSQDQGKTWKQLSTIDGKPGRATAFFAKTGIICGNGGMLAISNDRGATWATFEGKVPVNFTSAVMLNDDTGFVAGSSGMVMMTKDAGKTWDRMKGLEGGVDIVDITLVDRTIIAVGASGTIYSLPLK